jgi:hypothetical protein
MCYFSKLRSRTLRAPLRVTAPTLPTLRAKFGIDIAYGKNFEKYCQAQNWSVEVFVCEDAYCIFILQFLSRCKSIYSALCFFFVFNIFDFDT